jgi:adenosylmethionine-8-amino-7-oxononanoate aminotransferase
MVPVGKWTKFFLTGSGFEAMEIVLALSRQYFFEQDKNTSHVNFIAWEISYRGNYFGCFIDSWPYGGRRISCNT